MKFCVIGLGRFGYQTAMSLASHGMEVFAVDNNEEIVESIRDKVTQSVCFRIDSEEDLRALGIDEMDAVIVGMGESFEESIIVSALLKKNLGIKYVIARARNKIHENILRLVGVDKVIMPEQDSGIRLASSLSLKYLDFTPITDDFSITQITAPTSFISKTLAELQLRKSRNVSCIAIHKEDSLQLVSLEYVIKEGDILVLSGNNKDLASLKSGL